MILSELKTENRDVYKRFITRGLVENEASFRISLVDEINEDFPTRGTHHSFTLGAFSDRGVLMGVVCFKREVDNRSKLLHKGLLFRMYVADQYAGQGIAKTLIGEVISRVKRLPDIEQINLTVVATNERAKSLYRTFGFQTFGVERNAIKTNGNYLDEELMKLVL